MALQPFFESLENEFELSLLPNQTRHWDRKEVSGKHDFFGVEVSRLRYAIGDHQLFYHVARRNFDSRK